MKLVFLNFEQGLIQHIYHYFVLETQGSTNNTLINPGASTESIPSQDYVPMFDEHGMWSSIFISSILLCSIHKTYLLGQIQGYMRPPTTSVRATERQSVPTTRVYLFKCSFEKFILINVQNLVL